MGNLYYGISKYASQDTNNYRCYVTYLGQIEELEALPNTADESMKELIKRLKEGNSDRGYSPGRFRRYYNKNYITYSIIGTSYEAHSIEV